MRDEKGMFDIGDITERDKKFEKISQMLRKKRSLGSLEEWPK